MKEYIKPNCRIVEFNGDDVMVNILVASGEINTASEIGAKNNNYDDDWEDEDF